MKFLKTLLLALSVMSYNAEACDVCGCSASNQYLGLLPKSTLSFISLQYQYNSFKSDHPSLFENRPNEVASDYYNTVQLWGRYAVTDRLQVFAFVPYRYNMQKTDTSTYTNSGIGDMSVLANWVLIKDNVIDAKWRHQLFAGGGVKAPTGSYTGITAMDKQGLPNMQPGSASWDFIVNANYTVRKNAAGINLDAAYTFTTANKDAYKYGNKLNAGLLGFYFIKKGKYNFIPQIGVRYEYSLHDYDNYTRKWLNEQSGGYMSFATAGLQVYYNKIGAKVTYQQPLMQQYSSGYVTARQRIDVGIFLLF